jgi:hypothetical protein
LFSYYVYSNHPIMYVVYIVIIQLFMGTVIG